MGLDPVARRNLLNLIKKCGASVLFTTHRLDEAEYLCTRVAIMQRGIILYDGNIEDIKIVKLLLAKDYLAIRSNLKGELKILID